MTTIDELVRNTSATLASAGLANSRLESEFLIAAALRMPKTHLFLNRHRQVSKREGDRILNWGQVRSQGVPLAYISGEQPFFDLSLTVTSDVLIPRPETELLVERALEILDQMDPGRTCIDVGTGSGNIAICVARHKHVDHVTGIDLSIKALRLARRNAKKYSVEKRCEWIQGDLLLPVKERAGAADLLVANLPYVARRDIGGLAREVLCEPRLALDGGEQGIELIQRLITQAELWAKTGMYLLLEIGADQGSEIRERLKGGPWENVEIRKDLSGLDRIAEAQKRGI